MSDTWPVRLVNQATGAALELPGAYQCMRIGKQLIINEGESAGRSGRKKQGHGFDDGQVVITLEILSGKNDDGLTVYDKIRRIEEAFGGADSTGLPPVFQIVCDHARARGIKLVLFADLSTEDGNFDDSMLADLIFKEYSSEAQAREAQQVPPINPTESGGGTSPYDGFVDRPETWFGPGGTA